MMNISQAAKLTQLSSKQIRDYEKIGLLNHPARSASGYRCYDDGDIKRLKFIAHARAVGFSLAQIRTLLDLQSNPNRTNCEVKALTALHIAELTDKINELQTMKNTLQVWHDSCLGDGLHYCPIITSLEQD